jgi:DNA polymerase-3 subunit gamma/tau
MPEMLVDKLRPKNLDEVVGNVAAKLVLRGQFHKNEIAHTTLFYGPPGTGKTSLARLIALHLGVTPIEVNCGADGGIDNVREIIDDHDLMPLEGDYKVYILDEAHKLTKPAQSALLKPAEEPSDHAFFIFCTTNPEDMDKALLTRCLKLKTESMDAADKDEIVRAVSRAIDRVGVEFETRKDLNTVVSASDGSFRTLYTLLESLFTASILTTKEGKVLITSSLVKDIIGASYEETETAKENLAAAFVKRDLATMLSNIAQVEKTKVPVYNTMLGVYRYLRAVEGKGKPSNDTLELLFEMARLLANYELNWMHVESFAFRRAMR